MSGLIAIFSGIVSFVVFAPIFRRESERMMFLTLAAGFTFWYWIPALNLCTVGYIGLDQFFISDTVDKACWMVLGFQLVTFIGLWLAAPMFGKPLASRETSRDPSFVLPAICLTSALSFLALGVGQQGFGVLLEIANGLTGAREYMSFENRSQGGGQALLGLLEILAIWLSLFSVSWIIARNRFLTLGGIASVAALTFMFIATGTRAVLLQSIFLIALSLLFRGRNRRNITASSVLRFLLAAASMVGIASLLVSGFLARFSNDAGYAVAGPMAVVAGTLVVNNDMMRELSIVIDSLEPNVTGAMNFILTPFTFMLPSFLGFRKEIPYHLVEYNQLRAGIDLNWGQGNVFPGLIADFWLVFGYFGPLAFAAFLVFWSIVIDRLSLISRDRDISLAFRLAGYSYILVCFRNIQGGLALMLVIGSLVLLLIGRTSRLKPTQRKAILPTD